MACQGLWGPGAGPATGSQPWGGKERRARLGCFPHSPWTLREELSWAWGCHVSDSGDVMGGHRSGQGTGSFPFPFSVLCTHFPWAASPDPEAPAAPHPSSGKSPSLTRLWVAGFAKASHLGLWRAFCISSLHRLLHLIPLAFLSAFLPLPVREMAALAGPNIDVYHSFRAICLTI